MMTRILEGLILAFMLCVIVVSCVVFVKSNAHAHWEDPKACTERLFALTSQPAELLYSGPAPDGRDHIKRWKSLVDGTYIEIHYYLLPQSQGKDKYLGIPKSFWLDREGDGEFYEELFLNTQQFGVQDGEIVPRADCADMVHLIWDSQRQKYELVQTGRGAHMKVGDKVSVIKEDSTNATLYKGDIGIIRAKEMDSALVEFEREGFAGHTGYSKEINLPRANGWWLPYSSLQVVEGEIPVSSHDAAEQDLRKQFPWGHPLYIPIVVEQVALHSNKNHDYARGGDPLGNFTRVANMLKQWPNFPYNTPEGVAFIYALKQLDAEAWTMCQGGECKVEGLNGRTDDQAIYANLRRCMREEDKATAPQGEGDR